MTLVLSFSYCLYALMQGRISPNDLENAWFYLGCSREGAHDPECNTAYMHKDKEAGLEMAVRLRDIIQEAEGAGRVGYRKGGYMEGPPALLAELLTNVPRGDFSMATNHEIITHLLAFNPDVVIVALNGTLSD